MIMSSVLTGVGAGDRCFAHKLPSMQRHRVAYLDTKRGLTPVQAGRMLSSGPRWHTKFVMRKALVGFESGHWLRLRDE